jgi:hypothetical protein
MSLTVKTERDMDRVLRDTKVMRRYSIEQAGCGAWGNFARKCDAVDAAKRQRKANREAGITGRVSVVEVSLCPITR